LDGNLEVATHYCEYAFDLGPDFIF
jgi:hypothetical protein